MVGRKPIMLIGIGIFLVASILCGFAWDMTSLIVFRALQGLGAGAIGPMTITIVGDIYTLQERARVQGYVASVWAVAAVLGPTLGGLFAQFDLWRGIFFINIPLCIVAGWLLWRDFHESFERRRHKIDYAGAVLMTVSFTALILGVLQGGPRLGVGLADQHHDLRRRRGDARGTPHRGVACRRTGSAALDLHAAGS